ncbi:hypothetical protein HPB48_026545 [Haemaphysalis longicornis]|uniref:T-complex protein 1 subunit delta n=1 Tax=Haemaphysalis longicornis TaxID=44386 RepID=A0A9J6HC46_HAELO|nr:hypothetical protein HPB48_026545 [Haemaphysalis longicornis]
MAAKNARAANGDVTITNDGATILKQMQVLHPAAKMLVELSKAQDVEAGDGTTTVVVIAGSLLDVAAKLLLKGIHPTTISEAFQSAAALSVEILTGMSHPLDLADRESLLKSATTALNSKVVSQHASLLAPMAVDAVLRVVDPARDTNVDLRDIKVIRMLGGTVEDTELVDGLVFTQRVAGQGGPHRVEKAKIGLIQFCISPPKTDMDHQVIVGDYQAMDRVLREERAYILNIVKQIKKTGCNVLLVQKSILRDALSDLALHFLAKMKVLVVRDVEREDVPFVCRALGCRPIASLDHFAPEALGTAELVEEVAAAGCKYVRVTGVAGGSRTVSLLVRGSNKLVLEEAERSLHDALCVVRCLVKRRALIAGGGAPEMELSLRLGERARTLRGLEAHGQGLCGGPGGGAYTLAENAPAPHRHGRNFAEALEVVPYTLAEMGCGRRPLHDPIATGSVTNILEENVVQPLLVSLSAITLAAETVRSILKIDDIVQTVR